jgi:cell wall-associated NlpC family hydrolase
MRGRFGGTAGASGLAIAIVLALSAAPAIAAGGGLASSDGAAEEAPVPEAAAPPGTPTVTCIPQQGGVVNGACAKFRRARLVAGRAVAPAGALAPVKAAIAAANRIRTKPYIWGGGHGRWSSPGYDCSGAVSFALHGGDFLESPMDSGEMMSWGLPGKGRWITVYANAGHAFAVIDGLRWDTVGDTHGTGPRWHRSMVSTAGFVARHPAGY